MSDNKLSLYSFSFVSGWVWLTKGPVIPAAVLSGERQGVFLLLKKPWALNCLLTALIRTEAGNMMWVLCPAQCLKSVLMRPSSQAYLPSFVLFSFFEETFKKNSSNSSLLGNSKRTDKKKIAYNPNVHHNHSKHFES